MLRTCLSIPMPIKDYFSCVIETIITALVCVGIVIVLAFVTLLAILGILVALFAGQKNMKLILNL